MKQSGGFTLVELVVSIAVIGIASTMVSLLVNTSSTMWELSRIERADEDNRSRGNALMQYAFEENLSRLPAPYTGGDFTAALADPADATKVNYFAQQGLSVTSMNSDESAAKRVAVYQRIVRNDTVSIFGSSGEQVNISYDIGVVYQTECPLLDSTCNPDPTTGIPGESIVMTLANQGTWDVTGTDVRPYVFSTYVLQVNAVKETSNRLITVKNALREYFIASRLAGGAGDTTNYYPAPTGSSATDLSGASSAGSEGCEDGWYQLDASSVNVLDIIGLQPKTVYGQTVFGGAIEYCRDFDPAGAGENTTPHNGALRVNRNLTGSNDPSSLGGNVILSF